jgi:hypothetical protein
MSSAIGAVAVMVVDLRIQLPAQLRALPGNQQARRSEGM